MKRIRFFEPEDTPGHIHIGLRTLKTVIAVFIVGVVCWLRDNTWPAISMIAVIICMQPSAEKTLTTSMSRLLATFIGGVFGVGIVFIADVAGFYELTLVYYLAIALLMIPVIIVTLLIKKPSITALTCVVLVSVAISRGFASPYIGALTRIIDTVLGIVTALVVNLILPNHAPPTADN